MLINTLDLIKVAIAQRNAEKEMIERDRMSKTHSFSKEGWDIIEQKYHNAKNEYNKLVYKTKQQFENDVQTITKLTLGLTNDIEVEFFFGFDLPRTHKVREYVLNSKYVKDVDYKLYGDMNDLTLTSGPNSLVIKNVEMLYDKELINLIEKCDGSGSFNGAEY